MCFDRQLCFLFSVLCVVRAGRNHTTAAQVSQHYAQATVLDIGDQATMRAHSGIQGHHNHLNASKGGNLLTELYFCPRSEDLRRFELGPFGHSVSYNGFDLTGSTWQPTTFDKAVIPGLGFATNLSGSAADYAAGGSVPIDFAYINDGPAFAPSGGFIYKQKDNNRVIGAMEICSQDDDTVGYRMAFKPAVNFGNKLPDEFAVGRMQRVSLPQLQQAGAKRYTWVHKAFVQKYFAQVGGANVDKGGFLYEVNDGSGSHLEFYERLAYPQSNLFSKGGAAAVNVSGGGSGNTMTSGSGQTITLNIHVNP